MPPASLPGSPRLSGGQAGQARPLELVEPCEWPCVVGLPARGPGLSVTAELLVVSLAVVHWCPGATGPHSSAVGRRGAQQCCVLWPGRLPTRPALVIAFTTTSLCPALDYLRQSSQLAAGSNGECHSPSQAPVAAPDLPAVLMQPPPSQIGRRPRSWPTCSSRAAPSSSAPPLRPTARPSSVSWGRPGLVGGAAPALVQQ